MFLLKRSKIKQKKNIYKEVFERIKLNLIKENYTTSTIPYQQLILEENEFLWHGEVGFKARDDFIVIVLKVEVDVPFSSGCEGWD